MTSESRAACRCRTRRFLGACVCALGCGIVVLIFVILALLAAKARDTTFELLGAKFWFDCSSEWRYVVSFRLENPSPFGVTLESCALTLLHHSTGQEFGIVDPTRSGALEVAPGVTDLEVSGIFNLISPTTFADAIKDALVQQSMAYLDVAVSGELVASSPLMFGASRAATIQLEPADLRADPGSDSESACFGGDPVVEVNISTERGDATILGANMTVVGRVGPCQPRWRYFEVHVPAARLVSRASGIGDAVAIEVRPQRLDLQQPQLNVDLGITVERKHGAVVGALVRAAGGFGPDLSLEFTAPEPSTTCTAQAILAALPYLARVNVTSASGELQGQNGADVVKTISLTGGIGRASGPSTSLEVEVSFGALSPVRVVSVVGVLPLLAFVVRIERRILGCSPRTVNIVDVTTSADPLSDTDPLRIKFVGDTQAEWADAVAVAVGAALNNNSELVVKLVGGDNTVLEAQELASWAIAFENGDGGGAGASTASRASLVASEDDVAFRWLLQSALAGMGIGSDARVNGSAQISTVGVPVGRIVVAALPSSAGLDASLRLGPSVVPASPASVLQASREVLRPLLDQRRPNASVLVNGTLELDFPGTLGADVTAAVQLWPPMTPASHSASDTLAEVSLVGTLTSNGLQSSASLALALDEDWGITASGEVMVSGTIGGLIMVNLALSVPPSTRTSDELGTESCSETGSDGSGAWSASFEATLLGGDSPGQLLRVPCFVRSVCALNDTQPLPMTALVEAKFRGKLAAVDLESMELEANTSLGLSLALLATDVEVATLAMTRPVSGELGRSAFPVKVVVVNVSSMADLIDGSRWRCTFVTGPGGDFLGRLLDGFTLAEANATASSSHSSPSMPSSGPSPAPSPHSSVDELTNDFRLVSTTATSIRMALPVDFSDFFGADLTMRIGDRIDANGSYSGSRVAAVGCDLPALPGKGHFTLEPELALFAMDAEARARLENLVEILVSDVPRDGTPTVDISGIVGGYGGVGGFPLSMTILVPDLHAGSSTEGQNDFVKMITWSLFPLTLTPTILGNGCPCIDITVHVALTLYNPLSFGIGVSNVQGALRLVDPDGVNLWFLTALQPDPEHLIDFINVTKSDVLAGRENTTVDISIDVASWTGFRILDEQQWGRLTFKLLDGAVLLNIRHEDSPEGFELWTRFSFDSIPQGGETARPCIKDTGVTCLFVGCSSTLNATCWLGRCSCGASTCIVDGKCVA